jgi:molybdate/tungstate transport system ATP-binding protein
LIEAKVRARLGQFQLDAELQDGGIICLAGRNGSGKTSLLRAIAGFLRLDEGYVKIGSTDVTRLPVEERGVVMVTPTSFFPHLDVDSHVVWGARLKRRKLEKEEVLKVKSELGIDFGGSVRNLSLGMRERVALATALLASPRVILVDEAFSSLHERKEFIVTYGRLAAEAGMDLVFSSQDETDVRLCDHLYVMNNGLASRMRQGEDNAHESALQNP